MKLKKKVKTGEVHIPDRLLHRKNVNRYKRHTTLRDVMDYSRPFNIFYSGVEYRRYMDGCYEEGVRNFLMSFEYLTTKGAKDLQYYRELNVKIFIDSGAFTYMSNPEYKNYSVERWEGHIQRYLKWAKKNKDIIFAIANLDLERLVGTDQVWEWNRKYFEPFMLETGIPVCFIWHGCSGVDHWEKMCERYPYVGFSMASEISGKADVQECLMRLSIAEEFGALVHGMGMTQVGMLTKLPFYTVDSTTWKSGLRYGMFLTWTGTNVRQLRKEDWDEKIIPFAKLYDKQFDLEALYDYEEAEVIKYSVYAFVKAEEYLQQRLEPLTYWNRPEIVKQGIDRSLFPPVDWFYSGNYYDLDKYAEKLNINPEIRKLLDYVTDCTVYCMWDEDEYEDFKQSIINQYDDYIDSCYDKYINKISADKEKMLEELRAFFASVVRGENDKLLLLETPFSRVRKERVSYIDHTDKEVQELDIDGTEKVLKERDLLPEGVYGEDIDAELDEEIFNSVGLVPVRDGKGRFTGSKLTTVKKKTLLGNTPKLMCDSCIERNSCPEFRRGYVCAYNKVFAKFDTRNPQDVADALYEMANVSIGRLQRALVQENLSGGMISSQVSSLVDQNLRILSDLKKMESSGALEVMKRTITVRPDGTVEETQSLENPQSNGILAQLFSSSSVRPDVTNADELEDEEEVIMDE